MPPTPAVTTSINTELGLTNSADSAAVGAPYRPGKSARVSDADEEILLCLPPQPPKSGAFASSGRRLLSRALRSSPRRTAASSHGNAAAQQPSPSAPHPPSAPGGFCFSHTAHFLEGNQLFPPRTLPLLPYLSAPLSFRHFAPIHSAIESGKGTGVGGRRGRRGGLRLGNLNNFRGRRRL